MWIGDGVKTRGKFNAGNPVRSSCDFDERSPQLHAFIQRHVAKRIVTRLVPLDVPELQRFAGKRSTVLSQLQRKGVSPFPESVVEIPRDMNARRFCPLIDFQTKRV